jgi:hypothetical protein
MSSTTSKPSSFAGWLVQKTLGRFPSWLTFLLFSALLSLLAALFFQAILFLFFPFPLFTAALLAAFIGLNLLLYAALPRPRFRQQWQQVTLITAGFIAGVFIIEGSLRLLNPIPTYQILPSNIQVEYLLNPELLPGLEECGLYTTNSLGIRGDEYRENGRYNILAIGGSTTETALLDDAKNWTHLLQSNLNQENGHPPTLDPNTPVWVGNVGRSGGLTIRRHRCGWRCSKPRKGRYPRHLATRS